MSRRLFVLPFLISCSSTHRPAPASQPDAGWSHVVVKGDDLDRITQERYGSRHYTQVIEAIDHVDQLKLRIGKKLDLPPLASLGEMGKICGRWQVLSPVLWKQPDMNIVVPRDVSDELVELAAKVEKTAPNLANRLERAAAGGQDPMHYELDDVDRYCSEAIVNDLDRRARGASP